MRRLRLLWRRRELFLHDSCLEMFLGKGRSKDWDCFDVECKTALERDGSQSFSEVLRFYLYTLLFTHQPISFVIIELVFLQVEWISSS